MKPIIILSIVSLLTLSFCARIEDKNEAEEFAKELVQTYFDHNCIENYNLWYDSVRIINPYSDTIVLLKNVYKSKEDWCEKFNSKTRFREGYTYSEYLKEYDLKIFNKKEFTNKKLMIDHGIDPMIAQIFEMNKSKYPDDLFFFSGDHLNNSKTENQLSHFRSWQLLIRKTPKGWKIVGTLP